MTTSGVTGQFNLTADSVIDMAFRQCNVSPSEKTPDQQLYAQSALELILKSLPNDGYERWAQQTTVIGLLPYVQTYYLPNGALEVIKVVQRQTQWPYTTGAALASSGNAANAFDSSLATACIQSAPNGYIGYNFGSGNASSTVYWGVNSFGTFTYSLLLEYSNDGILWYTADNQADTPTSYTDGQWVFYEIQFPVSAQYYRIRETGGSTLSMRSVFFGINPVDTTIGRFNRDSYETYPTKYSTTSGIPIQFKVNEEPTGLYLQVWPVPTTGFYQLHVLYYTQPQDVGVLQNNLDIPYRWQKAVISQLAYELAKYLPNIPPQTLGNLRQDAMLLMSQVNAADQDRSNVRFYVDMRSYFRS